MLVAPTLGDTAKRFATVSTTCDHAGTFSRQTSSWPDIVMPELRHHLARCPRGAASGALATSAMFWAPTGDLGKRGRHAAARPSFRALDRPALVPENAVITDAPPGVAAPGSRLSSSGNGWAWR